MKLRPARHLRDLTQEQLSRLTGLDQPTISRLENNVEAPTKEERKLLENALEILLDWGEKRIDKAVTVNDEHSHQTNFYHQDELIKREVCRGDKVTINHYLDGLIVRKETFEKKSDRSRIETNDDEGITVNDTDLVTNYLTTRYGPERGSEILRGMDAIMVTNLARQLRNLKLGETKANKEQHRVPDMPEMKWKNGKPDYSDLD